MLPTSIRASGSATVCCTASGPTPPFLRPPPPPAPAPVPRSAPPSLSPGSAPPRSAPAPGRPSPRRPARSTPASPLPGSPRPSPTGKTGSRASVRNASNSPSATSPISSPSVVGAARSTSRTHSESVRPAACARASSMANSSSLTFVPTDLVRSGGFTGHRRKWRRDGNRDSGRTPPARRNVQDTGPCQAAFLLKGGESSGYPSATAGCYQSNPI